jgi:hypothetical protein
VFDPRAHLRLLAIAGALGFIHIAARFAHSLIGAVLSQRGRALDEVRLTMVGAVSVHMLRRSKFKVQQPLISRILSGHRQEHIRRDRETMHA